MVLHTRQEETDEDIVVKHGKIVVAKEISVDIPEASVVVVDETDEETPEASAPPLAHSVPLPLHDSYKLNHDRNHSRKINNRKNPGRTQSARSRTESDNTGITDEESLEKTPVNASGSDSGGACGHLAYALFLFCIVWPLSFVTANLWVLSKVSY